MSADGFNSMIGDRIKRIRKFRGMTTTQLARKAGISQAQISRLENACQGFRTSTIHKIAQKLKVPVTALVLNDACIRKAETESDSIESLIALAETLEDKQKAARLKF
mgnify:CR=1 FL=1